MTLPLTINETLKWFSSLPILMQESFWWWQCSNRYIISLFPLFQYPLPPFSPSIISFMVSVDIKHHVYLVWDWLGVLGVRSDRLQRCPTTPGLRKESESLAAKPGFQSLAPCVPDDIFICFILSVHIEVILVQKTTTNKRTKHTLTQKKKYNHTHTHTHTHKYFILAYPQDYEQSI